MYYVISYMSKISVYFNDEAQHNLDTTLSHVIDSNGKNIAPGKALGIVINHLTPTYIMQVLQSYGYQLIEPKDCSNEDQRQEIQV